MHTFKLYLFVALLLLLSACQSAGSQPAQPDNEAISSFEISPINGSRFYRHPSAHYPVAFGEDFQFSISAREGTVRFSASNLKTREYLVFGEHGGPTYSTSISTWDLGWFDAPVLFCGENRVSGDWDSASALCTIVHTVAGRGCTLLSDGGSGCPDDFPDYGALEYSSAPPLYNDLHINFEDRINQVGDSVDPPILSPQSSENKARITAGTSNRLRSGPGTGYEQTGTLPEFTEFTILSGPTSSDGYSWYHIQLDDGTTGYTAGGDGSEVWVVGVNAPQSSTGNNEASGNDVEIVSVTLTDGSQFAFQFNRQRNWILNGSDYVVAEINKIEARMSGKTAAGKFADIFRYATPFIGESHQNRDVIQNHFCGNDSSCKFNLQFLVGDRIMDISGAGNIIYGYYVDSMDLPMKLSDVVANWDQLPSSLIAREYVTVRDNPDDIMQRKVGRELRSRGLSVNNLEEIADELGLY